MSPPTVVLPRLGDLIVPLDGVRLIVVQVLLAREIACAEPEFGGGPEREIAFAQLRATDPGVWQEMAA